MLGPVPNFQEGGYSSSTAVIEVPNPANVKAVVQQIE